MDTACAKSVGGAEWGKEICAYYRRHLDFERSVVSEAEPVKFVVCAAATCEVAREGLDLARQYR